MAMSSVLVVPARLIRSLADLGSWLFRSWLADCSSTLKISASKAMCDTELPCGHFGSKSLCSYPCENRCSHGVCPSPCHDPCTKCKRPCAWRCQHFKCTKLCYEICDRPRCDEPCPLKLPCGHTCIGLCGEPCPSYCRLCHPEVLDAISQRTLGESEVSERFMELVDCSHIFEVRGLDQWIDSEVSDSNESEPVKLKCCPACRSIIRRTLRYSNEVKAKLQLVEEVKKRTLAQHLLDPGRKLLREDKFKAARSVIRKAIEAHPGLLDAHACYALACIYDRMFTVAISHLRLIVERSCFAEDIRNADIPISRWESSSSSEMMLDIEPGITASDKTARDALLHWASALACMHEFKEAGHLLDLRSKHFQGYDAAKEELLACEARAILYGELGWSLDRWYTCQNGHLYAIGGSTECTNGPGTQRSRCPDCGEAIGRGVSSILAPIPGVMRISGDFGLVGEALVFIPMLASVFFMLCLICCEPWLQKNGY